MITSRRHTDLFEYVKRLADLLRETAGRHDAFERVAPAYDWED